MGLFTDDGAHEGRKSRDVGWRACGQWPGPRQLPVETVFPAVSLGARTPDAREREPWGLTMPYLCASDSIACFVGRHDFCGPNVEGEDPLVEAPAWPLNRPFQGRAGWSFELEDGLLQNKAVRCWVSRQIRVLRLVVKASIAP